MEGLVQAHAPKPTPVAPAEAAEEPSAKAEATAAPGAEQKKHRRRKKKRVAPEAAHEDGAEQDGAPPASAQELQLPKATGLPAAKVWHLFSSAWKLRFSD